VDGQVRCAIGWLEPARRELARHRLTKAIHRKRVLGVRLAVRTNQWPDLDGKRPVFAKVSVTIVVNAHLSRGRGRRQRDEE
jgi:hypothetical protein